VVSERRPFQGIDDIEEEPRRDEADPSEVGPIVGGMGQLPGSGATGLGGAGMAPAISAGVTRDADEDLREEPQPEEAETGQPD
jgi:hypothetical protein